jgi:hypothetical protein
MRPEGDSERASQRALASEERTEAQRFGGRGICTEAQRFGGRGICTEALRFGGRGISTERGAEQ